MRAKVWSLVCIVSAGLMVSSAVMGANAPAKTKKEPYKVGAFLSVTGSAAPLGTPERDTILMIQDQINKAGGIAGHPLEVVIVDDASEPSNAVKAVKKLIDQDKVCAIIGGSTTGTTLAAIPIAEAGNIPLVSCAAGVDITNPLKKNVFRVAQLDSLAVDRILEYLGGQKAKKIGIIYDSNAYGSSGRDQIRDLAPKYKITVAAEESFGTKDSDMTVQLAKLKASGADAIICWGTNPGPAIVARNAKQLGLAIPVIQSHGVADHKFIELAGDAANGTIFPAGKLMVGEFLANSDPQKKVINQFAKSFKAKYGYEADHFGAHGYDAIQIITAALAKVGDEPSKLRNQIEKTKGYVGAGGVFSYSPSNHDGLTKDAFVMVRVVKNDWQILRK